MKLSLSVCLTLTLVIGAAILSGGCKKSSSVGSQLTGSWKLILYTQGFSGSVVHTHPDSVYTLSMDGFTYKKELNGSVYESGTYHISNVKSIYSQQSSSPAIVFGGVSYPLPQVIGLRHDTLDLSMNAYDANSFEYVKVSQGTGLTIPPANF
jgi:hypothetical protein